MDGHYGKTLIHLNVKRSDKDFIIQPKAMFNYTIHRQPAVVFPEKKTVRHYKVPAAQSLKSSRKPYTQTVDSRYKETHWKQQN